MKWKHVEIFGVFFFITQARHIPDNQQLWGNYLWLLTHKPCPCFSFLQTTHPIFCWVISIPFMFLGSPLSDTSLHYGTLCESRSSSSWYAHASLFPSIFLPYSSSYTLAQIYTHGQISLFPIFDFFFKLKLEWPPTQYFLTWLLDLIRALLDTTSKAQHKLNLLATFSK